MRTQITIFNDQIPKSHHADALTDEAILCRQTLFALSQHGLNGATAEELARELALRVEQVGPALGELRSWHRVRKTEARRNGRSVYLAIGEPK